jgi:hypothetical protein
MNKIKWSTMILSGLLLLTFAVGGCRKGSDQQGGEGSTSQQNSGGASPSPSRSPGGSE